MIRIYEGCDGSGKSTKAQQDAEKLGCEYVHNPVDWLCDNPYKAWLKFFEDYKDKDICVDRSFIGNPIYRTWDNGYESSDFLDEELEELCRQNYVLIYCESDTEYEDATIRGEDNLKTKDDYNKIKELYNLFIENKILPYNQVYKYNWRTGELQEMKKENLESLL